MPIEFNCPHCQKPYKVGDTNAGKRFACKQCGQPVEVPGAAGQPMANSGQAQVPAPQPAPVQRPRLPGGRGPGGPRLPGGPRPAGGARPPMPRPVGAPGGHPPQQYGQPGYGPPLKPHRGTLILVLGILSWAVCGLIAIPGLIMGGADIKEMRAGIMDRSGEGITKAGYYLSMVAIILFCLGLVAGIVLFAMAGSMVPPERQQYQQPRRYSTVIP